MPQTIYLTDVISLHHTRALNLALTNTKNRFETLVSTSFQLSSTYSSKRQWKFKVLFKLSPSSFLFDWVPFPRISKYILRRNSAIIWELRCRWKYLHENRKLCTISENSEGWNSLKLGLAETGLNDEIQNLEN